MTGWRVKVTESMGDRTAPVVGASALFAPLWPMGRSIGVRFWCVHIRMVCQCSSLPSHGLSSNVSVWSPSSSVAIWRA